MKKMSIREIRIAAAQGGMDLQGETLWITPEVRVHTGMAPIEKVIVIAVAFLIIWAVGLDAAKTAVVGQPTRIVSQQMADEPDPFSGRRVVSIEVVDPNRVMTQEVFTIWHQALPGVQSESDIPFVNEGGFGFSELSEIVPGLWEWQVQLPSDLPAGNLYLGQLLRDGWSLDRNIRPSEPPMGAEDQRELVELQAFLIQNGFLPWETTHRLGFDFEGETTAAVMSYRDTVGLHEGNTADASVRGHINGTAYMEIAVETTTESSRVESDGTKTGRFQMTLVFFAKGGDIYLPKEISELVRFRIDSLQASPAPTEYVRDTNVFWGGTYQDMGGHIKVEEDTAALLSFEVWVNTGIVSGFYTPYWATLQEVFWDINPPGHPDHQWSSSILWQLSTDTNMIFLDYNP